MESVIYEGTQPIGTLKAEAEGLYWRVECQVKTKGLCRVYATVGLRSQYLGIPNAEGKLSLRLAKKLLPQVDSALADCAPRGPWLPWRGEVDGVFVDFCYIKEEGQGLCLALPETEAVKFPAWTEDMHRDRVYGTDVALLTLDSRGRLPLRQKENGGTDYETNDGDGIDPLLLADLPADYSYGDTEQQEADRNYL